MKKQLAFLVIPALLAACGDTVENTTINQTGLEVVASEDDLPKCNKDNEGEQVYVKSEETVRLCVDGDWAAASNGRDTVFVAGDTVYRDAELSCKTVELKDKSGLKIVCNGDSIGVVLNGKDGKDAVTDTSVADTSDKNQDTSFVVIVPQDTAKLDSEMLPVASAALTGVAQKGPFLKGSTVTLYGLSDGRKLKPTGINYTTDVVREDGRFRLNAQDLPSQYVQLVAEGLYRNEVSGKTSDASIRLNALTDLRNRDTVNVNVLTHLEYERVRYLVTRKNMTVEKAKRQAQKEVLAVFGIELEDYVPSENLDVFGATDADAALLAISILLHYDSSTVRTKGLLAEMSAEIAETGTWHNDSFKASMADWALSKDKTGIRDNMAGWGLKDGLGNVEKYIDVFVAVTYGIESCVEAVDGSIRVVMNKNSRHNGDTLYCKNGLLNKYYVFLADDEHVYGSVTSASGITYRTVTINGLEIMAENMRDEAAFYATFVNFDYNNSEAYGLLYDFRSAMQACPDGWRLPTKDEMDALIAYAGADNATASKHLRASVWADGDNQTGFNGLPAGFVRMLVVSDGFGTFGVWWTETESSSPDCYYALKLTDDDASWITSSEELYASVRCVKDKD